jgi:mono/diheme cytochrome c family protein
MRFLIGLVIGVLLVPIGVSCYLHYGHPPVAVADAPFPFEKEIVHMPMHARIAKEMPKTVPIQPTADNLTAGAQIFRQNCAFCHGLNNQNSTVAPHMYPHAPQLWHAHGPGGVVGVSDDPPAQTYWTVANGIRLSGMPAFEQVLSSTQIWQVSLLLANANKSLPQPTMDILAKPLMFEMQPPPPTTPQPTTSTPPTPK